MKYMAFNFFVLFAIVLISSFSDSAVSSDNNSTSATNHNYGLDIEKVIEITSSTINGAIKQFSLPLYSAYFKVVAEDVAVYALNENYRRIFEKLDISTDLIRVGYSPYLSSANNKVAMTDCNIIYFPSKSLVDKITAGEKITQKQMHLLLHEIGHTQQCQEFTREMYARQWFNDLNPAATAALKSGQVDAKIIHDAMPLEQDAEAFAKKMMLEVVKH